VIKCPEINNLTGIFLESPAYQLITGACPGGKNGNPTRQCLHDGTWREILSPCT